MTIEEGAICVGNMALICSALAPSLVRPINIVTCFDPTPRGPWGNGVILGAKNGARVRVPNWGTFPYSGMGPNSA